ncbi:MAG: 2-C-methyl-D-erythritol 2,4-cyclodiphosphate synthase [Clostridiales bacterium]|nr:2-C-methyl-D-erythritol 2,4-cyclodiphosphate synthase [Clostridiales bacterium]
MRLLENAKDVRFGVGFDCHRLVEDRKLILGGVTIPHDKGLLGHSDADVLTHAIMDAILSSLAMRDIGYHFPDKDPQYKGANSVELLIKVLSLIKEKGYRVKNISATIMAEKPKLLSHIPQITKNLADVLKVDESSVGIGATTLEGLGFVGREEGICVHATAVTIKE